MGEKRIVFESEEPKALIEVAAFLREMAEKLQQGRLVLRRGGEEIVLNFPAQVVLEVKVEQKQKKGQVKHHLEIEIEWLEGYEAGPVEVG